MNPKKADFYSYQKLKYFQTNIYWLYQIHPIESKTPTGILNGLYIRELNSYLGTQAASTANCLIAVSSRYFCFHCNIMELQQYNGISYKGVPKWKIQMFKL
jgi:hypothetical protein